ncbi:MAG: ATP-dependent sacrificial sulfur transferase LarE [Thermacetogeniaceae bacterium]
MIFDLGSVLIVRREVTTMNIGVNDSLKSDTGVGDDLQRKLTALESYISQWPRVIVAFSGGVDSSLVLRTAIEALGTENVLAVTVVSPLMPQRDQGTAAMVAAGMGARRRIVETDELQEEAIAANPPNRCFYCKSNTFGLLTAIAREEGYRAVLDGTNRSDCSDYRPGMAAIRGFDTVHSPLLECGLDKQEVRRLARQLGLPNWNLPAQACLASRIPYGVPLTLDKLEQIARAEAVLAEFGLDNVRVRHHGQIARIEVAPEELEKVLKTELLQEISRRIKACGFTYAALDLDGYRTGSLNEVLASTDRQ